MKPFQAALHRQSDRQRMVISDMLAHEVAASRTGMLVNTPDCCCCCRGNGASVLRIVPYAAIHFGSYEYFRRGILEHVAPRFRAAAEPAPAPGQMTHPVWDLIAGSASGAAAVMATYPLDLVRTRLAWATESGMQQQAHSLLLRDPTK